MRRAVPAIRDPAAGAEGRRKGPAGRGGLKLRQQILHLPEFRRHRPRSGAQRRRLHRAIGDIMGREN